MPSMCAKANAETTVPNTTGSGAAVGVFDRLVDYSGSSETNGKVVGTIAAEC